MSTKGSITNVDAQVEHHNTQDKEALNDTIHHPKGWLCWQVVFYMIVVGLSMGLYGYDNTFAAPLMQLPLFIIKYQGPALTFTARNLNLMVPVPLVGAAIGTFIAPPMLSKFGRKITMVTAYFLFCTPGSFLQLFAPNMAALVIGRFWNYLGVSMLTTTAPLYLSELVPAHVRGRAIGFCVAGVSAVGVLATTVVWGTSRLTDARQYQIPLALQAAFPVGLGALTLLLPESPVWCIQKGKIDQARKTLMTIRNKQSHIVETELSMAQLAISADEDRTKNLQFWQILNRENLGRTLASGALLSLSQVCGQVLVLAYSTVALVQSGVGNPFEITIIITCLVFFGTLIGPLLVDRVGRRPVALIGFSILIVLNMAAGSLAAVGLDTNPRRLGLASVFILFGFFNAVSFQSLAFLLPTELPTPSLREPTVAWCIFWSYVTAIITTFAVPQIMNPDAGNLGAQTAFIFGGFCIFTVIWSYFYLPETRSRTLAEIDEMYKMGLPVRKWKGHKTAAVQEVKE